MRNFSRDDIHNHVAGTVREHPTFLGVLLGHGLVIAAVCWLSSGNPVDPGPQPSGAGDTLPTGEKVTWLDPTLPSDSPAPLAAPASGPAPVPPEPLPEPVPEPPSPPPPPPELVAPEPQPAPTLLPEAKPPAPEPEPEPKVEPPPPPPQPKLAETPPKEPDPKPQFADTAPKEPEPKPVPDAPKPEPVAVPPKPEPSPVPKPAMAPKTPTAPDAKPAIPVATPVKPVAAPSPAAGTAGRGRPPSNANAGTGTASSGRPTAPGSELSLEQMQSYQAEIQETFSKEWLRPYHLAYSGQNYVATVRFRIRRDGSISNVTLARPSGNKDMDKSVMHAAKRVRNVSAIPAGSRSKYYEIFVEFAITPVSLNRN